MDPILPANYPYPGVRITPAGRGGRALVLDRAAGTVIPIPGKRDLLVADNCVEEFHQFRRRFPKVVGAWREVWCLDNQVPWPDPDAEPELTGEPVELDDEYALGGMFRLFLYEDRDAALADLARGHERVGLVWTVCQDGAPKAKAVARAVLDGDHAGLAVLADALEDDGDPRAATVRAWLGPAAPKGRGKRRRWGRPESKEKPTRRASRGRRGRRLHRPASTQP